MASQWPPKKNTAFTLDFTLYKNDGTIVANPGTYTKKVSIDGGDVADIAANVTEENTTYGQLSLVIASGEMNGDRIWIYITDDTAGTVPFTATLLTSAYTLDEIGADLAAVHVHAGAADVTVNHADHGNAKLVRSTTPANTLDVAATGEAGLDFNNIKDASGAKTLTNITIPVVTTLTGHTAQTGDVYALANGDHGLVSIQDDVDALYASIITNAAGVDIAADIIAIKTVVDTIQADTDLLDDAIGGLADIHTDVAAVKSETAELKAAVITNAAGTDIAADIIALKAETVTILADTAELQTNQGNWLTATGFATPTNITAGTITTVTNLTNAPTNGDLTATMKASVNTEVDTALNTAIPGSPTADSINERIVAIDAFGAPPSITTMAATIAKLETTLVADGAVSQFTANALELAPTGGSAPTVDQIVDGILDEVLHTAHEVAGSTSVLLQAAGGAADPLLNAVPGSYGVGTAGYVIGTNLAAVYGATEKAAIDLLDDAAGGLADVHTDIGTLTTELAKVPKSDSNVTWNATALASINAEVVDVITVDTVAEMAEGTPPASPTIKQLLNYLYRKFRNKIETTNSVSKVYDDAGTAVLFQEAHTDDATTFTKGKFTSTP